ERPVSEWSGYGWDMGTVTVVLLGGRTVRKGEAGTARRTRPWRRGARRSRGRRTARPGPRSASRRRAARERPAGSAAEPGVDGPGPRSAVVTAGVRRPQGAPARRRAASPTT